MRSRSAWVVAVFLLCQAGFSATPGKMDLQVYLKQVRENNQEFRAAAEISEGARMRSAEGDLLLSPVLFANIQKINDEREPISAFQGSKSKSTTYTLGVSQLTPFGMQAKLYYTLFDERVEGASATSRPFEQQYFGSPTLELTQSLWKNGFGRETRAQQELLEAQGLALSYAESAKLKAQIAEAEVTYWKLALAQETVELQKESLDRSEKIQQWSARRSRLHLADRSDYLQSNAAFLARKLEYQTAVDAEKEASRAFNSLRGLDIDVVGEELVRFDQSQVEQIQIPVKSKMKDEVKAAEQQSRVAMAAAKVGEEKNRPTFDVFANGALSGRDEERSEATSESFTSRYPYWTIGLKFSTPLNIGGMSDAKGGYAKEVAGAELRFQRQLFEQDRAWSNLIQKFNDTKMRFSLALEIEKAQREKLMVERERHQRGRTTTYQVIVFEQDLANAQLARVGTQTELLSLVAEMKTFSEEGK